MAVTAEDIEACPSRGEDYGNPRSYDFVIRGVDTDFKGQKNAGSFILTFKGGEVKTYDTMVLSNFVAIEKAKQYIAVELNSQLSEAES